MSSANLSVSRAEELKVRVLVYALDVEGTAWA